MRAQLLLSVPPEVNTTPFGPAPVRAATLAREAVIASLARAPYACPELGLPKSSSALTMACFTSSWRGVVAWRRRKIAAVLAETRHA
eukprot:scaffold21_cov368-Prasinococcus_capsulatus_cf.AAC.5